MFNKYRCWKSDRQGIIGHALSGMIPYSSWWANSFCTDSYYSHSLGGIEDDWRRVGYDVYSAYEEYGRRQGRK